VVKSRPCHKAGEEPGQEQG